MPGTEPVATAEGGVESMERFPRGTGQKKRKENPDGEEEDEEIDPLEVFFTIFTNFRTPFRNQL